MIKGQPAGEDERSRTAARPRVGTTIDETSKRIVEMLQLDGRRTYASIGRALGIDERGVELRVQALLDAGVIIFTIVADPLEVGFTRQAMLGVSVDQGQHDRVAQRLAQVPEVAYLVLTGGGFDLMAEVVARSDAHLEEIVSSVVRPIPGVREVHTFPYDAVEKETYSWGVL